MKWVFFMPSRAASRFIICAKTSSEPAAASASAMQASLPDCTTMPRISSSTATGRLGSTNMREPGARQARDRKSTRLNSSHSQISYAVFCLKKKKKKKMKYQKRKQKYAIRRCDETSGSDTHVSRVVEL